MCCNLTFVAFVVLVVCPVGTYFVNGSNNASSACVPCPLGFYKDQEGGQQCRSCGPDRNTTSLGARNTSECLGNKSFSLFIFYQQTALFFVYGRQLECMTWLSEAKFA